MTYSEQLAAYVTAIQYEEIPAEVVEFTKLCVLDYYASLLNGKDTQAVEAMRQVATLLGGIPQATDAFGQKTSITHAAFINAGASHVIELDDIHKASIVHAATVIMPAAIAVAEWLQVDGKKLIEAIIVGYEVAFRVGEAVSPSHYDYFHNTATCGTFGAAAAVAKLLELNQQQIVHALGSAGTQAAGLWEFIEDGAMSKQLHPAKAAMNGILSALLAERGFTGASAILEGRRGFFEAMTTTYDASKITNGLGKQYKIIENAFKIHASCRHTHAAMDIAVALSQQYSIDQIERIAVGAYEVALNITDAPQPDTIYAAKFSMQFCVALALLTGSGSIYSFNEQTLTDAKIRACIENIEVYVAADIQAQYPQEWGSTVTLYLNDGSHVTRTAQYPKGDPENPLTTQDFIAKFNDLVPLSDAHRQQIIACILQLEQQSVEALISTIYKQPAMHLKD